MLSLNSKMAIILNSNMAHNTIQSFLVTHCDSFHLGCVGIRLTVIALLSACNCFVRGQRAVDCKLIEKP